MKREIKDNKLGVSQITSKKYSLQKVRFDNNNFFIILDLMKIILIIP